MNIFDFLGEIATQGAADAITDLIYKRWGMAGCAITLMLSVGLFALLLWSLGVFGS